MQLYGSLTSPYVRHVRIVLAKTGQPCELVETDAAGSATGSPTQKVPYLRDGNHLLTDSTSILRYLRDKAGQPFLTDVHSLDGFCLVNTLMDSAINLFLLARSGVDITQNSYLQRQSARIQTGLDYLNAQPREAGWQDPDAWWRLNCFLYWGTFRGRFTLDGRPQLQAWLADAQTDPDFQATAPQ